MAFEMQHYYNYLEHFTICHLKLQLPKQIRKSVLHVPRINPPSKKPILSYYCGAVYNFISLVSLECRVHTNKKEKMHPQLDLLGFM